MTDTRSLDRSRWTTALDGHQYEAERLPFSYLGYDPKDDVVIVAVGGRSSRFPRSTAAQGAAPEAIDIATVDVPEAAVRVLDQEDPATLITFFPAAAAR
ncbi:hypothetical protein ACFY7H_32475 [Streptomyces sp. NPDC012794]|uniref:hypothetical protein n=1 Tax=Streptomyces sp. NPDC012794 TaxID=3364850 RepID=UPI003674F0C0